MTSISNGANAPPWLRVVSAVLLSALTFVGGHFYNRRWDRALLFSVLFVFWTISVYATFTIHLQDVLGDASGSDLTQRLTRYWGFAQRGATVLWITSIVYTYFDSRRSTGTFGDRWTLSGLVGAFALSFLFGVAALAQALIFALSGPPPMSRNGGTVVSREVISTPNFSHFVYLGKTKPQQTFPRPPRGDGYLTGRFEFEDKPATDLSFKLGLNGEYETDEIVTDRKGEFALRLPPGEWRVTRLITQTWRHHPEGNDYTITTGAEPVLANGRYDENFWFRQDGIAVAVGNKPASPQLMFTIRKDLTLRWPEGGGKRIETTVDKGVISWDPYPNAAVYLVQIHEAQRAGNTTSYREVATRPVTETEFRLQTLPVVGNDDIKKEYTVKVLAFDHNNHLLSESERGFDSHSFVLTDNKQFLLEDEQLTAGRDSAVDIEQMYSNNRRLDAAVVLLNEGMDKAAEQLLAKIKGSVDETRKTAVTGYLLARQGRCAEAEQLFARANTIAGRACVPESYHAACRK